MYVCVVGLFCIKLIPVASECGRSTNIDNIDNGLPLCKLSPGHRSTYHYSVYMDMYTFLVGYVVPCWPLSKCIPLHCYKEKSSGRVKLHYQTLQHTARSQTL